MENERNRPSRPDWVKAGLKALAEGGIGSVKVERLAASLGVSKGPFYWRFADRGELLRAIVDYWNQELTATLIEQAAHFETPKERLTALAEESIIPIVDGLDIARTEYALRVWATSDPLPRAAVVELDRTRVMHLRGEFQEIGAPAEQSERLALAVYLALLGLYTARQYTPELASDEAFRTVVAAAINEAEALAGRAQV